MPQAAVTTKALLTRQQRRTILRHQLRDTGSTVWPDAPLNACLNEALAMVQARYPWVRSTLLTTVGYRTYDLPADFVRARQVFRVHELDGEGVSVDPRPGGQVIGGYEIVASGGRDIQASAATSTHVLALEQPLPDDERLLLYYEAARQPWGDITVVGSGVDATADQDLRPGELTDGEADLLFYAVARCAAYRYALGHVKADGGDDWAAQYEYALRERDRLLGEGPAPLAFRLTNGLF